MAVSFAKQLFQSAAYKHYETDMYSHFSNILSTDTNKICVTRDNFREIVTFLRRYPRCEIKIVPRIDLSPALKTDSPAASTPLKSAKESDQEDEEDNELEPDCDQIVHVPADGTSQKKSTSSASQPKKKRSKSAKATAPLPPVSPVESPQGKLTVSATRKVASLPKLCNPCAIAAVHRDHIDYLEKNCLPILPGTISGEQLFHRIVQHCSANKGNNYVLVSRPFKSTTTKVDGVPIVVRQVSYMLQFWYDFICPYAHFLFANVFPLLSLVL